MPILVEQRKQLHHSYLANHLQTVSHALIHSFMRNIFVMTELWEKGSILQTVILILEPSLYKHSSHTSHYLSIKTSSVVLGSLPIVQGCRFLAGGHELTHHPSKI